MDIPPAVIPSFSAMSSYFLSFFIAKAYSGIRNKPMCSPGANSARALTVRQLHLAPSPALSVPSVGEPLRVRSE